MISPRRVVSTVGAVLVLLFLYHTITGPEGTASDQGGRSLLRSYPPSLRNARGQQHVIQDMSSRPLRDRLKYYFPYDIENKFPAYIWQTWKSAPSSEAFEARLRPHEATWTEQHPTFVHEVIVDDAAEHLIRYLYASTPEVAEAYAALPLPVLKADFFRYLILLARGGIYSDIDTQVIKPAPDWLPADLDPTSIGLVVGIEADPNREDWHDWYARRIQFCQWTIQAKPGHPILRDIVASITETTLKMQRQGQLQRGRQPATISIMEFTGPGIWTDAIFSYWNNREFAELSGSSRAQNVTVQDFFELTTHKKMGDVMVLPITSFSPGVDQMGAGDVKDPMAFVHHEFDGSWKSEAERMKGKKTVEDEED